MARVPVQKKAPPKKAGPVSQQGGRILSYPDSRGARHIHHSFIIYMYHYYAKTPVDKPKNKHCQIACRTVHSALYIYD